MTPAIDPSLTVAIAPEAHRYAKIFATEQASAAKGKRVYLNTLAVCAVQTYLDWLSIPTNLSDSDCWHPGQRALFDVADLLLPNIGKLECRPVLPEETEMPILPSAVGDRIGYVAVRLSEDLRQANLIGFVPTADIGWRTETIALETLQPLDTLIAAVHPVDLRSWFKADFTPGWLSPEQLLSSIFPNSGMSPIFRGEAPHSPDPSLVFRGGDSPAWGSESSDPLELPVIRGKRLRFEGSEVELALVLTLTKGADGDSQIQLQLRPTAASTWLPQGLGLQLLDETATICAEAISRERDDLIRISFGITPGESFSLQLTLDGETIKERFQF